LPKRFTQRRWLDRLEKADLPDEIKLTGRLFIKANGRRARWTPYYEAAFEQDQSVDVLSHLHRIGRQNLAVHNQGHFLPVLGPLVPRAGQFRLTAAQMGLVVSILTKYGGRGLYYIARHGYLDSASDKPRWLLKPTHPGPNGKWQPTLPVPAKIVNTLLRHRIIESSGCTWGGFNWTREFRVNCFRLYSLAGLPKNVRKYMRAEAKAEGGAA